MNLVSCAISSEVVESMACGSLQLTDAKMLDITNFPILISKNAILCTLQRSWVVRDIMSTV